MLYNWIKIFIYHLKQNKLFSFLNVLGLSIGIAGLVFATLYWNNEHSYDVWNPNNENVYQVLNQMGPQKEIWASNSTPFGLACKATIPEIESICFFGNRYDGGLLKYKSKKLIVKKAVISDEEFFNIFPFPIVKGAKTAILKEKNSVAISDASAKLLFNEEDPIGKSVNFENEFYTVRAVYKIIQPSAVEPDYVFNGLIKEGDRESWGNFNYGLMIKVKKDVAIAAVVKKMEKIVFENITQKNAKESGQTVAQFIKENGESKIILDQLKTARLQGTKASIGINFPEGQGNLQLVYIMMGLSILILVLSIVNYINLATATAIKRAKEVGVRKVVGASKSLIVMQFIFETAIVISFAVILALAIVELTLPFYNDFLNKDLTLNGSDFYGQIVLIFVLVIVFAGIFPAIYISKFETLKVLKGNFSRSKSGIWMRNSMLVFQFSIAAFFIIGALVVYQQVSYMSDKDLGFSGDQIIRIRFRYDDWETKLKKYETTKQELLKMSGVQDVSTFEGSFGDDTNSTSGFTHNGIFVQGHNVNMDFGFLDMMKIKILEGRDLSPEFASDTVSNMLMNETCVRTLNLKKPINTIITSGWGNDKGMLKFKIVGVVKDFNITGLKNKIPPMIFVNLKTLGWSNFHFVYVKVNADDLAGTLAELETYWNKNINQDYPFEYEFVDKTFAKTYLEQLKQKNLFFILNLIVIVIAIFGLFALASFSMERRLKEIAIRKTLGAETNTLLKELSIQYVFFCLVGFLIGIFPAYLLLQKWLEDFAFRIDIPLFPFVVALFSLLFLTLLVVLAKAYQVTKMDALKYLKYE
ncbi:ABC transporter permease [Flavobacterium muglaense]|uniref:ABC transporter permease n=1 Tax=Flavobacterium muglaense TaxID=2764716 RepID=A0A923SFQ6_9FLAO|nr:ABC transporter permease [Flavobacterium muglaense]MBC5838336.1 ABC transporter permease [Flavobacterium muglaense]MBC5844887.1 ABC transporter permease [Flavobacterium muglaense]